jgi:hypothetical protein
MLRRWPLILLLAGAAVASAHPHDPLAAIDACLTKLDAGLDVGYARIAERCPDLSAALTDGPWAPWLPSGWDSPKNELSAQGLSELRLLLSRAEAAQPSVHAPGIEGVHAILAGLKAQEQAHENWWTRFKAWLRGLFEPRGQSEPGWFERLFGKLLPTEAVARVIVWCALGTIVVLAGGVVLNELRVAGLLGRRSRAARATAGSQATRPGMALRDIDAASPREQPAMLLELIATRLGEQGRLPPARAFTALEVARNARLSDEDGRVRLGELARASERVRFSGAEVAPASLSSALRGGRELLAALEAV